MRQEDWLVEEPPPRRPGAPWPLTPAQTVAGGVALLVVLLVALAIGGVFSGNKAHTTPPPTLPTTTASTATKPTVTVQKPPTTTLKPGDTGTQVRALQRTLVLLGYAVGTIDGTYGPATQNAVASFQTAHGLTADGVLGPKTLAAITAALAQRG